MKEEITLIPMTDFVLEQNLLLHAKAISMMEFSDRITKYAFLLKTPITKGMFVPCDEDGNVLEEPVYTSPSNKFYNESYCKRYQQAKERVLFDGFTWNGKYILFGNIRFFRNFYSNFIIEHLAESRIYKLSETAVKQIFG